MRSKPIRKLSTRASLPIIVIVVRKNLNHYVDEDHVQPVDELNEILNMDFWHVERAMMPNNTSKFSVNIVTYAKFRSIVCRSFTPKSSVLDP